MMARTILLVLCIWLTGCDPQTATVVDIRADDGCPEKIMSLVDTSMYGRTRRCGYWGEVGETFAVPLFW